MHIDVIEDFDALEALRPNWDRLYAADPEAHYFLSWIWIATWLKSRPLPWLVLAAKDEPEDDGYVAFFPVQIGTGLDKGRGFYNTIVMGGSYYAVYTGILCDPVYEDLAVAALADRIREFNWTSLHLDDIYMSSERLDAFLDRFPQSDFVSSKVSRPAHITASGARIDHDLYVYVPLADDFEHFLNERLGAKTRRNVRLCLRKLDGGEEFRVTHADADSIERDLETFHSLWQSQWGAINPRYARYILDSSQQMLSECFNDGTLLLSILWRGETPLAAFVILLDRPRRSMVCFLGARDLAFKNPSPGLMLHAANIRWGIENGFERYDLGTGDYAYKYMFGSKVHRIERLRITTRSKRNLGERLDPRSLPIVVARAKRLRDDGDPVNAQIACRQILAVEPSYQDALALYRDIGSLWVPEGDALPESASVEEAFAFHRAGNLDEAEKLYRAVIADDPSNFDAAHQLGILLLQRGEVRSAEAEIRRALEIRPTAASAHCNYGNLQAGTNDFDGAMVSYDRAIELEPLHAIAFNNRGNVLRRLGRPEEALWSYERAIALQPAYRQAIDNRQALLKLLDQEVPEPA
ncbi:GNAT family N-acetyltransferase [Rhizobium sp. BK376]|uniref:GNAT family N-acetyltransferase n=1 Tax=Rhizobium sp. BK376 TaxID=2512149 RepID=UPI00105125A6|nr:GNAT family N-acetyltransferase [Rhizobium sp. BK376]TCR92829.1 CelD/BcsL family acetyltransferase involved in cellulose biosynthesis [Rhizobium sp. BK376]